MIYSRSRFRTWTVCCLTTTNQATSRPRNTKWERPVAFDALVSPDFQLPVFSVADFWDARWQYLCFSGSRILEATMRRQRRGSSALSSARSDALFPMVDEGLGVSRRPRVHAFGEGRADAFNRGRGLRRDA